MNQEKWTKEPWKVTGGFFLIGNDGKQIATLNIDAEHEGGKHDAQLKGA